MVDHAIQIVMIFLATVSFSYLFVVPNRELGYCGLTGACGWIVYLAVTYFFGDNYYLAATLVSTMFISVIARVLSYRRKMPITIYLIAGIIPLVPGAYIYNTMLNFVVNNTQEAIAKGIETFKIAGIICIGIVVIFSLPRRIFDFFSDSKS